MSLLPSDTAVSVWTFDQPTNSCSSSNTILASRKRKAIAASSVSHGRLKKLKSRHSLRSTNVLTWASKSSCASAGNNNPIWLAAQTIKPSNLTPDEYVWLDSDYYNAEEAEICKAFQEMLQPDCQSSKLVTKRLSLPLPETTEDSMETFLTRQTRSSSCPPLVERSEPNDSSPSIALLKAHLVANLKARYSTSSQPESLKFRKFAAMNCELTLVSLFRDANSLYSVDAQVVIAISYLYTSTDPYPAICSSFATFTTLEQLYLFR